MICERFIGNWSSCTQIVSNYFRTCFLFTRSYVCIVCRYINTFQLYVVTCYMLLTEDMWLEGGGGVKFRPEEEEGRGIQLEGPDKLTR